MGSATPLDNGTRRLQQARSTSTSNREARMRPPEGGVSAVQPSGFAARPLREARPSASCDRNRLIRGRSSEGHSWSGPYPEPETLSRTSPILSNCSGNAQLRSSPQSPQVPRTSITGRADEKPALAAAFLTPPESASSSMCTACPQVSQIKKMQSCRQSG